MSSKSSSFLGAAAGAALAGAGAALAGAGEDFPVKETLNYQ
jgi:hypothetical protein